MRNESPKALLFLNGEQPSIYPKNLYDYEKIFATDGAYIHLKKKNIFPDLVSGDFDSFKKNELDLGCEKEQKVSFIKTPDQNYTDFEKALFIIYEQGFSSVDIFGASGRQQDHFLGNLAAAFKYKEKLKLQFFDDYSSYFFIPKEFSVEGVKNKIISLFPFPKSERIYTKGLQYPLFGETLDLTRIGIRNKALEAKIEISYKKGNLLIFIER